MWTFQPRAPLYHNIIMFISIESMSLCIFCAGLESQGTQTQVNRGFQALSLGFKVNPTVNDLELFVFEAGEQIRIFFNAQKHADKPIPCYLSVNHLTYKVYGSQASGYGFKRAYRNLIKPRLQKH